MVYRSPSHTAKYVVARFWPFDLSAFDVRASFRILGSSLDCILSATRICSARRPSLFFCNRTARGVVTG